MNCWSSSPSSQFWPPETLPSHNFNEFNAQHYGRYIYYDNGSADGTLLSKNSTAYYQSHGLLYPLNYAGSGAIYYCPGMDSKSVGSGNSLLQSAYYAPLLTVHTSSSVRSVYCFNPWADKNNPADSKNYYRMYPKTTSFRNGPKVLIMEFLVNNQPTPTDPLDPSTVAHDRIKMMNVAFSDMSVQSLKITAQMWKDAWAGPGNNLTYPTATNVLVDLEAAH